jgi:molybdate transport system ATP-binding protein
VTAPALDVDVTGRIGDLTVEVTLRISAGSTVPTVIVGPNGAGKTSALMMILGALTPTRGRVALDDVCLFDAARGIDVPIEERRIGFLPQRYALFPHLDVLANVAYGIVGEPPAARARRASGALRALGVEGLARRRPQELSGGEAQRVGLARALAHGPRALLLDEPLAALDVAVRRDVRQFLVAHLRALAIPTVIVTHDRADAEAFDGELLVLERGVIGQRGTLGEVAARPATAFARTFFGSEPEL